MESLAKRVFLDGLSTNDKITTEWQADLEAITDNINTGIPAWVDAENHLLDADKAQLRHAMLMNPSNQALGPLCKHTVSMVE